MAYAQAGKKNPLELFKEAYQKENLSIDQSFYEIQLELIDKIQPYSRNGKYSLHVNRAENILAVLVMYEDEARKPRFVKGFQHDLAKNAGSFRSSYTLSIPQKDFLLQEGAEKGIKAFLDYFARDLEYIHVKKRVGEEPRLPVLEHFVASASLVSPRALSGSAQIPLINRSPVVEASRSVINIGSAELNGVGLPGKVVNVLGDGNCFFHAVVHEFRRQNIPLSYHEGLQHLELRTTAVNYLRNHPELLKSHPPENETIEAYLERMSQDGVWVEGSVIDALALSYKVHLIIYDVKKSSSTGELSYSPIGIKNANDGTPMPKIGLIRKALHYQALELGGNEVSQASKPASSPVSSNAAPASAASKPDLGGQSAPKVEKASGALKAVPDPALTASGATEVPMRVVNPVAEALSSVPAAPVAAPGLVLTESGSADVSLHVVSSADAASSPAPAASKPATKPVPVASKLVKPV